jgi:hypothetical protein
MECFGDGFGPMSRRNVAKLSHRSQMAIPRPPYSAKKRVFGFRHLDRIARQHAYSGDSVPPTAPP